MLADVLLIAVQGAASVSAARTVACHDSFPRLKAERLVADGGCMLGVAI